MSLLTKTTLLFLLVAMLVFSIGGVVTYRLVKQEVQNETDYYLNETFQATVRAIRQGKSIEALDNEKVVIERLSGVQEPDTTPVYQDTLAMHILLNRLEPHRNLTRITKIDSTYYRISLTDVFIESDDINEGVVTILSRLFLFLSLALLIAGVLISRWLFKPFMRSLQKISKFNLKSPEPLYLPRTSTREFSRLNDFITEMTEKARGDYRSLKEFTENASHEMQTPIAIAKGKLELLLESPQLDEEQAKLIQSAYQSISKLSSIGHSLTLLNKIENREFAVAQTTDFSRLAQQAVQNFRELAELKALQMEANISDHVELPIDPALGDILLSNLIKNAIQHNHSKGWIRINLQTEELTVQNTGPAPSVAPHLLFERFRKGNQSGGSLGLGLSIVKKITEACGWEIDYHYTEDIHTLQISFSHAQKNRKFV